MILFCVILGIIYLLGQSPIGAKSILAWVAIVVALFLMFVGVVFKIVELIIGWRKKRLLAVLTSMSQIEAPRDPVKTRPARRYFYGSSGIKRDFEPSSVPITQELPIKLRNQNLSLVTTAQGVSYLQNLLAIANKISEKPDRAIPSKRRYHYKSQRADESSEVEDPKQQFPKNETIPIKEKAGPS